MFRDQLYGPLVSAQDELTSSWLPRRWNARVIIDGKRKHLGDFDNEDDAAHAYDRHKLPSLTLIIPSNCRCRHSTIRNDDNHRRAELRLLFMEPKRS